MTNRQDGAPPDAAIDPMVPADIRGQVAIAATDPYANPYAGPLRPQDAVLLSRGGGIGVHAYRVYEEIERDGRVSAVLDKRRRAVTSRDWSVEPADTSRAARKAAALMETALQSFDFDAACGVLLEALLMGYAVGEVIWRGASEGIFPAGIKAVEQRRVVFVGDAWETRLLTRSAPLDGEAVPDRKFIIHRHGNPRDPYGRGLGHQLFWPVYFKRLGGGLWLDGVERHGAPYPVGKVPPGTLAAERESLLDTLLTLRQGGAAVIDDNQAVEFLEAAMAGGWPHEAMIRYWDEEIVLAVLGELLTTMDASAKAAAGVHNDIREELADADADSLSGTLNDSLIKWIIDINMPGAPYPTVWRPRPERQEDIDVARKRRADVIAAEAAAIQAMRAAGFAPEDAQAAADAQAAGRWLPAPPANVPAGNLAFAAALADALALPPPAGDEVDQMTETLRDAAAPFWADEIDAIQRLIDGAPDLAAVPDLLLAHAGRLDAHPLAALLENAMTAAALGGAYTAADAPEGGA